MHLKPEIIDHSSICESWKQHLEQQFQQDYFQVLKDFVEEEQSRHTIFPEASMIFRALNECRFEDTRVVILGQDPYHGPGQAHGLSFSVSNGVRIPPSLRNIFKELRDDLGCRIPQSGDLSQWSEQGVLLLNAMLTVRASAPGSHQKKGWETFTDSVIEILSDKREHLVFILWGAYAEKKSALIDENKHLILRAAHPSPLSAHKGFFGCRHFSKTNEFLVDRGYVPINWCIQENGMTQEIEFRTR